MSDVSESVDQSESETMPKPDTVPEPAGDADVPAFHPAAGLFPLMQGREFDELAADIKTYGLREPITRDRDGLILDGRNRLRACAIAGIEPRYETYDGDDPVAFVVSRNLHRRHLTDQQRGWIAGSLCNVPQGVSKIGSLLRNGVIPMTAARAGALMSVRPEQALEARKVQSRGVPELVEVTKRGELGIQPAARIATKPPDEQRRILRERDDRKARPPERKRKRKALAPAVEYKPKGYDRKPDDQMDRLCWALEAAASGMRDLVKQRFTKLDRSRFAGWSSTIADAVTEFRRALRRLR